MTDAAASPLPDNRQKARNRSAAPVRENPIRALILDDSNFDRKRLRRIARQIGVPLEITDAASMIAFEKQLDATRFNIVFIDHRLPEGDGMEALKMLRDHPINNNAAGIVVAGELEPDTVAQAFRNGCKDYIAKHNLDTRGLRHSVLTALGAARQSEQHALPK